VPACIWGEEEKIKRYALLIYSVFFNTLYIFIGCGVIENMERESFAVCEKNGEDGLTWDEVELCEVRWA
jgi:hypothetical protein